MKKGKREGEGRKEEGEGIEEKGGRRGREVVPYMADQLIDTWI